MFRTGFHKLAIMLLSLGVLPSKSTPSHQAASYEPKAQPNQTERLRHAGHAKKSTTVVRNPNASMLLAGSVQLLGMGEIKKSLGPKWNDLANAAYRITEETIRKFLHDEDAYERHDAETYVLCFAHADKPQAEAITERIAQEIMARVAKETPDLGLSVKHTIAELEWASLEQDDVSIVDAIAKELQTIRENAEAAAATWRRYILRNATIRYSPVWSPKTRLVSIHRVLLDEETGRHALKRMAGVSDVNELTATLFDLDCLIVGRSVKMLDALLQGGGQGQLLIPVNFNSLTAKQNRESYLKLCRDIPEPYRRYILLELHGAAAGTPTSRIAEIARAIKPYAHDTVVEVRAAGPPLSDFAAAGISRVSVDINALSQDLAETDARLTRLVSVASALNLKLLVHGADTIGLAELATRARVDFIEGRAVALTTEELKSVYRWKPQ